MDHVHRISRPELRNPRAILAWEGWNDACDAASGAVAYLLGQRDDPDPFAWIEPEDFYDFQVHRPRVEIDDGGTRRLTWPQTRAFALDDTGAHDLVLTLGEEPNLRWKTYTRSLAKLLDDAGVEMIVTLGAFIGQVAHTRPIPIVGVATDPALIEQHRLLTSHDEGPTGIVGVMHEACREVGIPTIGLWAATPHYLAANPNPKAMLALLTRAREILRVDLELTELEVAASEFEQRVDAAMTENDDFVNYVRRLEEEAPEMSSLNPHNTGELIDEIEDFLRER
jgi:proteasome assembly chaperone (PAC2) family protein